MNIEIKNLNKCFENNEIFKDFSVLFSEQIIAISGESGCGKTTLLRMIAGLDNDYTGEILNVPKKVAYVFQEDRLLPWKSIFENLAFVGSGDDLEDRILSVLKKLGLSESRDMLPDQLSGGMQRRVALGRAYIYDSDLILMDEPFQGLSLEMRHKVADEFFAMVRAGGKSVIVVTHDDAILEKADVKIVVNG
jgi:NitT/TauT family transport system ATP-binding protein